MQQKTETAMLSVVSPYYSANQNQNAHFLNYKKVNENVNLDDYNFIARYGTTDENKHKPINSFLEDVFYTFNVNHPKNFKGHSLSVSDIVAIKIRNEIQFYFTDSIGFVHLPEDVIIQ